MSMPIEISRIPTVIPTQPDDVLVLAASWEERCLGVARKLAGYSCNTVLLSIYDGPSTLREKHIDELVELLAPIGKLNKLEAKHSDPLPNVRETVDQIKRVSGATSPRVSIDVSTFTRKHLLQLLQGLDLANLLENCQLFYTEPYDYHTQDNEPISQGISSVKAIETFLGQNSPSRDSLLVVFLGYEGRRALALWEHLEPNATIAVIADPPYHQEWHDRTETQNKYLLSCLPKDHVRKSHSLDSADTERLLCELVSSHEYPIEKYNYRVAPLGTRAQTLGVYRFWRRHPGLVTVMYARPVRYREERATFAPGRTWLIDTCNKWTKNNPH